MYSYNKTFVYFICLVSALGGLLFGYDWVVIGGAKPFYELYFGIADSPSAQGLAMTIALVGCMIGAMVCGWLADRIGRKRLLIVSALIFLLSSVATGAFSEVQSFRVARFFGGIGIGVASGLSPMYIAEVAPARVRGKLVSLNQMTIVLGILGAQITNWLIADPIPDGTTAEFIAASWNGQMAWRWMFWAAAVPSALFLVLAFFIPESPRWLALKDMNAEAFSILTRIGGKDYADGELAAVKQANAADASQGGLRMLFGRPFRRVLLLGVVIAVFQQWCGTNVIFNYAQEIFQSAGYEIGDVLFNIVVTGVANVVFTVVAIFTVDRLGRRALMLLGAAGLCAIYLILGRLLHDSARGARHSLLRHDARPLHVGAHIRAVPQPRARRGRCHLYLRPVGGLLHAHLHLPAAQHRPRQLRHVLDLLRRVPRWPAVLRLPPARDQGQVARRAGEGKSLEELEKEMVDKE